MISYVNWETGKVSTWQDLQNSTLSFKQLCERQEFSYRRGYFDAVQDVLEAFSFGFLPRQLEAYFNNQLWEWRMHGDCSHVVWPPKFPDPWKKIRKRILERDNHKCHYCGGEANSVDHKNPVVNYGSDNDDNLVACCMPCNLKKMTRSYEEFMYEMYGENWSETMGQK